ncbi:ABC transporter substrate-binding protein [Pseudoclavibacter soli]|uniref:ABC transporter substrate-binding protein n=1 Tax=Pseudoclavibacter soli TaxID=452623 RepID=UPI00042A0B87|nr:ABC transporter substrate-binding protein [Pseudoclavibacter soli]
MNTFSKLSTAAGILAVGALALGGCTSTAGNDKLISSDKLVACSEAQYAPFESIQDGKIVGIDADIAAEIAKDLNVELEHVNSGFEGLQSGADLDAKKCDIAISAITITDERATKMDFSEPYFSDNLAVVARADSGITSTAQATDGQYKIVVQQGTTGEDLAEANGWNASGLEDAALAAQQVENGTADVLIDQIAPAKEHLAKYPDLKQVDTIETNEQYGIAIRKGNTDLLDSVNSTLDRIKSDGTLDSILSKWGANND